MSCFLSVFLFISLSDPHLFFFNIDNNFNLIIIRQEIQSFDIHVIIELKELY